MLLGGPMALGHSRITENWNPVPVTEFVPFLECAFLLIIVSNLICYNLYGALLRKYTATFMSFAGFSTPLFTAFFGWLFLGETVSFSFYLSAVIVFAGLILFNQEELGKGVVVKAVS
jgi:drug/metabolite transporter (DMT)-like permease